VDAVAGERVEVAGKRGDERFAFAGLHLGDFAGVKDHAADHLNVEVTHADGADTGFAHDGEGLGEDFVERALFSGGDLVGVGKTFDCGGDAGAEFGGLGGKLLVGELFERGLVRVDLLERGEQALDGTLVGGAEDFGE
jgi:hypothetical protein